MAFAFLGKLITLAYSNLPAPIAHLPQKPHICAPFTKKEYYLTQT